MIPLESPVPEIGPPGSESGGRKRAHGTRSAARLRKHRMSHRTPLPARVELVQSLDERETFNLPPPTHDLLHDHDLGSTVPAGGTTGATRCPSQGLPCRCRDTRRLAATGDVVRCGRRLPVEYLGRGRRRAESSVERAAGHSRVLRGVRRAPRWARLRRRRSRSRYRRARPRRVATAFRRQRSARRRDARSITHHIDETRSEDIRWSLCGVFLYDEKHLPQGDETATFGKCQRYRTSTRYLKRREAMKDCEEET